MPVLFLIVGALLIITAINDKLPQLGELVGGDFQSRDGSPSFVVWMLAIFIAGSIGFIKDLKPLATAFLVLICVGMILSNKGFFDKFTQAIRQE